MTSVVRDVHTGRAQGAGHGGAACDGLEASDIAATAGNPGGPVDGDVPHVAGGAIFSALQLSAADDSRSDACGYFEEQHVVRVRPRYRPLAQGHDIDVVIQRTATSKVR